MIDRSHSLLIHRQDLTRSRDLFCRGSKNLINDGDLLWMDCSLAVKSEILCGLGFPLQPFQVSDVKKGGIHDNDTCRRSDLEDARSDEKQSFPRRLRAKICCHVRRSKK